jgi:signal transduction histidine kinase
VIGWCVAFGLALAVMRLRRRLELVARAEHELRGPLTAFAMGLEGARRGRPLAGLLDAELERARVALADLTAARRGRRAVVVPRRVELERLVRSSATAWGARLDWRAGTAPRVDADAGRVAQALGNLLANAAEHGGGEVVVRARDAGERALVLEVANPAAAEPVAPARGRGAAGRGRGLSIAAAAACDAGGALAVHHAGGEFRATLELPLVT